MSSDITNHILRRQYTAHKGNDLLNQVHHVVCLVSPNGFTSAGFHPSGEVLIVNSSRLDAARWSASFIEYELLNDPLLAAPDMIKSIFVAATKNLIIPEALYTDDTTAQQWLQNIFYCEHDEQICVQHMDKNAVYTCFAFPELVQKIFKQYISDLSILPLNLVHFKNSVAVDHLLQCTITDGYVLATLQYNKVLQWQQMFEFQNAEDIAYKLAALCQQYGIELKDLPTSFTTTSIEQYVVLKKLYHYIPLQKIGKAGIADIISPEWSSTIHLFQHLYGCA